MPCGFTSLMWGLLKLCEYIEAGSKWLPFCTQNFQIQFPVRSFYISVKVIPEFQLTINQHSAQIMAWCWTGNRYFKCFDNFKTKIIKQWGQLVKKWLPPIRLDCRVYDEKVTHKFIQKQVNICLLAKCSISYIQLICCRIKQSHLVYNMKKS